MFKSLGAHDIVGVITANAQDLPMRLSVLSNMVKISGRSSSGRNSSNTCFVLEWMIPCPIRQNVLLM